MRIGKQYLLQPAEEKRWLQLVTLEAQQKTTPEQTVELDRLQRKRIRLLYRHPKMKESRRAQRNADRRLQRKLLKVDAALKKLGLKVRFASKRKLRNR